MSASGRFRPPARGPSIAPDMLGLDPALAALDVEQAPAVLAIADAADDAGLRAIGDRGRHLGILAQRTDVAGDDRSEEHTSELQSLMRISYAVFCLITKINSQSTTSD